MNNPTPHRLVRLADIPTEQRLAAAWKLAREEPDPDRKLELIAAALHPDDASALIEAA